MMDQEKLWHDDVYDAYKTAVMRLGGYKKVGPELRPEIDPIQAADWLRNCLDRSRREILNLDYALTIKRMARQVGCHVIAAFENETTGYGPPQPVEPQDEVASLQREFVQATEQMRILVERAERAQLRLGRDFGK